MSQTPQLVHSLWFKEPLLKGVPGDCVRVVTEPTFDDSNALVDGGWKPVARVFGPAHIQGQLERVARDEVARGGDLRRAVEFYFVTTAKVEPMVNYNVVVGYDISHGGGARPREALLKVREALESDGARSVSLTFTHVEDLDALARANDDFSPSDGWINPADVEAKIAVLEEFRTGMHMTMCGASSDEAARQCAEAVRRYEYAQKVLGELLP